MSEEVTLYYNSREGRAETPAMYDIDKKRAVALPEMFFLEEPGFYEYQDHVWRMEEEGLYEFIDSSGTKTRRYYYHNDIKLLLHFMIDFCEFGGIYTSQEDFEKQRALNQMLTKENEKKTPLDLFLITILFCLRIAYRSFGVYSNKLGNTIFNFIEIWDEKHDTWQLYWVEGNQWLGATNAENTCFDIFEKLKAENSVFLLPKEIESKVHYAERYLALNNKNLKEIFLEEDVFPALKADGHYILRAYTLEKYHVDTDRSIKFANIDYVEYKLFLMTEEYLRDIIYGKQIYIFHVDYVPIKLENK